MTIQMLPVFYDMDFTEKDGHLTSDAYLFHDQTFQALNIAIILLNTIVNSTIDNGLITNNGIQFPQYTTAQITAIAATAALGTVWFNTDIAKLQVLTATGVVETITST